MTDQTKEPLCDRLGCPLVEGRHYRVDPDSGCWEWLLWKNDRGYGHASQGWAHRIMWVQSGRQLEPGEPLHHRCHNRACINPDHLEPMGQSRHMRLHWWKRAANMTPEKVAEIKQLTGETTLTQKEIADRCGVSREAVVRIANGRAWDEEGDELRKPDRACLLCGAPVPSTKRRNAVFCSKAHRITYNSRKLTERRRAAREEMAA